MDWMSLDTDIFEDGKISELLRHHSGDGFTVYIYILTNAAKNIDVENEQNGYFDCGGEPVGKIAWQFHIDKKYVEEILETLDELGLIDYQENEILVKKLMDRKHVQSYLKKQSAGQKGAKSRWGEDGYTGVEADGPGNTKADGSPNGSPNGSGSGSPNGSGNGSGNGDKIRLDKDSTKVHKNRSDSGDSEQTLEEKFGKPAVKATEYLIKKIKEYDGKTPVPDRGQNQFRDWVQAMDRLHRLGAVGGDSGFSWDKIKEMIDWTFNHVGNNGFRWGDQVESATGFRDKITKIHKQFKTQGGNDYGGTDQGESRRAGASGANRQRIQEEPGATKETETESGTDGYTESEVPF